MFILNAVLAGFEVALNKAFYYSIVAGKMNQKSRPSHMNS